MCNSDKDFKELCQNEVSDIIEMLKPESLIVYGSTESMGYDFKGVPVKYMASRRWEKD